MLTLSQEAESLAQRLGDQERLAHVYTYLINYHYLKGEPDLAIEYGERCLATAEARHDLALQALARRYMGHCYHAQGRYRQAEEILRRNVELLEAGPAEPGREQAAVAHVASAGWLALTLAEVGEFELANRYVDEAQRVAEASNLAYSQTIAWSLAGAVWVRRGHLERAMPLLERSLHASREKSLIVWRPIPASLLGLTFCLLGRFDEGLPLLEEGVALSEELGLKAYLALWTTHLGEGLLAAGQAERALAATRQALDLARAHKEEGHRTWALRLQGEIASHGARPDVAKAEAAYLEAVALAERLGMRPLLALSRLGLARLHRRAGDRAKAEDHLSAAVTWLHQMDMRFWLEQAEGEIRELGGPFAVPAPDAELYQHLKRRFSRDATVTILQDRRRGARRQRRVPHQPERRRGERRRPAAGAALSL